MVERGFSFTRRDLLAGIAGACIGKVTEEVARNIIIFPEAPLSIEAKIRIFEEQHKNIDLIKEVGLREEYTDLLAQWYDNIYSGVFAESEEKMTAARLKGAITWVTNPNDPELKGNENFPTWSQTRSKVVINLLDDTLKFDPNNTDQSTLLFLRKYLSRSWTNYVVVPREEAIITDIIKSYDEFKDYSAGRVVGFTIIFQRPDQTEASFLVRFNSAANELIAYYDQKDSALPTLPPSDPDIKMSGGESAVETIIRYLESILRVSKIPMNHFSGLHDLSSLDGLAISFADATNYDFDNDEDKITYGYDVINALDQLNYKWLLENYQKNLK